MTIVRSMPALDAAIDAESYQFLSDNFPELVDAIQAEVARGALPADVGRYVARKTQRPALALRVEQAARHVASLRES